MLPVDVEKVSFSASQSMHRVQRPPPTRRGRSAPTSGRFRGASTIWCARGALHCLTFCPPAHPAALHSPHQAAASATNQLPENPSFFFCFGASSLCLQLPRQVLFAQGMKEATDRARGELSKKRASLEEQTGLMRAVGSAVAGVCRDGRLPQHPKNLLVRLFLISLLGLRDPAVCFFLAPFGIRNALNVSARPARLQHLFLTASFLALAAGERPVLVPRGREALAGALLVPLWERVPARGLGGEDQARQAGHALLSYRRLSHNAAR